MKNKNEQASNGKETPNAITQIMEVERMEKMFIAVSICREVLEISGYNTSAVDDDKMEKLASEIAEALDPYMNEAVRNACDRVGISMHPKEPKG
jgi:hypothetical protein